MMHDKIVEFTQGKLPLFETIAIETSELCNRTCGFCPNSVNKQQKRVMSEEHYRMLINQLKDLNYSGTLCFHQYNEPLLDKRLDEFIGFARENLKHATLMISSNGDALTKKRWDSLRENGLNYAVVSQYDGVISDKVQNLMNSIEDKDKSSLIVKIRGSHNLKSTRCGTVNFEYAKKEIIQEACLRPFYQLVIRFNCLAVLCSEDYYGRKLVGNTKVESLTEIWFGTAMNEVRESLINKDRKGICASCNTTYNSSIESCEWVATSRLI